MNAHNITLHCARCLKYNVPIPNRREMVFLVDCVAFLSGGWGGGRRKVREVKKLDSDMQMLVYENYNKFISATDTIRKMAQNVEGMETEMADLKGSMDRISESSATVNASLEGEMCEAIYSRAC